MGAGTSSALTAASAVVELLLHSQALPLQQALRYLRHFTTRIFSVLYSKPLRKELSSNITVNKMPTESWNESPREQQMITQEPQKLRG